MLMVKAMQMKVGNPLRKLVLLKLADNANDKGECWPSYQHIAEQCEIARSTVKNHVRDLEEAGLLKRVFRKEGTKNKSNIFVLTLDEVKNKSMGGSGDDLGQQMPEVGQEITEGGSGDDLGVGHQITPEPVTLEPVNESKQSSVDDGKNSSQQTDNQEKSENPAIQQHQKKPADGYSEAFEAWWSIYPKKVGKGDAWKSWKRDKLDKKSDQLIEKLEAQNAMQYSFTEYKFIPLPATYLNQSRYDDEVQLVTNGGINETSSNRKLSPYERVRQANDRSREQRTTQG